MSCSPSITILRLLCDCTNSDFLRSIATEVFSAGIVNMLHPILFIITFIAIFFCFDLLITAFSKSANNTARGGKVEYKAAFLSLFCWVCLHASVNTSFVELTVSDRFLVALTGCAHGAFGLTLALAGFIDNVDLTSPSAPLEKSRFWFVIGSVFIAFSPLLLFVANLFYATVYFLLIITGAGFAFYCCSQIVYSLRVRSIKCLILSIKLILEVGVAFALRVFGSNIELPKYFGSIEISFIMIFYSLYSYFRLMPIAISKNTPHFLDNMIDVAQIGEKGGKCVLVAQKFHDTQTAKGKKYKKTHIRVLGKEGKKYNPLLEKLDELNHANTYSELCKSVIIREQFHLYQQQYITVLEHILKDYTTRYDSIMIMFGIKYIRKTDNQNTRELDSNTNEKVIADIAELFEDDKLNIKESKEQTSEFLLSEKKRLIRKRKMEYDFAMQNKGFYKLHKEESLNGESTNDDESLLDENDLQKQRFTEFFEKLRKNLLQYGTEKYIELLIEEDRFERMKAGLIPTVRLKKKRLQSEMYKTSEETEMALFGGENFGLFESIALTAEDLDIAEIRVKAMFDFALINEKMTPEIMNVRLAIAHKSSFERKKMNEEDSLVPEKRCIRKRSMSDSDIASVDLCSAAMRLSFRKRFYRIELLELSIHLEDVEHELGLVKANPDLFLRRLTFHFAPLRRELLEAEHRAELLACLANPRAVSGRIAFQENELVYVDQTAPDFQSKSHMINFPLKSFMEGHLLPWGRKLLLQDLWRKRPMIENQFPLIKPYFLRAQERFFETFSQKPIEVQKKIILALRRVQRLKARQSLNETENQTNNEKDEI